MHTHTHAAWIIVSNIQYIFKVSSYCSVVCVCACLCVQSNMSSLESMRLYVASSYQDNRNFTNETGKSTNFEVSCTNTCKYNNTAIIPIKLHLQTHNMHIKPATFNYVAACIVCNNIYYLQLCVDFHLWTAGHKQICKIFSDFFTVSQTSGFQPCRIRRAVSSWYGKYLPFTPVELLSPPIYC